MMDKQSSSYLSAVVLYKRKAETGSMHSVGSVGVARGGSCEMRGLKREDVGTSGRRASGVLTPEVVVNLRNQRNWLEWSEQY